jgi:hypothetical protein
MNHGHSISSQRVFELARSVVGACPGGREAAPELFAVPPGQGVAVTSAAALIRAVPAWAGATGAILINQSPPSTRPGVSPLALLVAWIEPCSQVTPGFQNQLSLNLPAGRYMVLTFDSEKQLAVGSESALGTPVVCGPPFAGAAVAVVVRPWAAH